MISIISQPIPTNLILGFLGVGKTTAARIIAAEADCPLVLLNFESIGSMYHSESERNFKDVLEAIATE